MRNKQTTIEFYVHQLGWRIVGDTSFAEYAIIQKDGVELHFFLFEQLNPAENYGQVYLRTNNIQAVYQDVVQRNVAIHPNGKLQTKPWGQIEFSLLDPDNNLLTFGESVL